LSEYTNQARGDYLSSYKDFFNLHTLFLSLVDLKPREFFIKDSSSNFLCKKAFFTSNSCNSMQESIFIQINSFEIIHHHLYMENSNPKIIIKKIVKTV